MNTLRPLLYIFLLLISPDVFANIFNPSPTDESVTLLGVIFGPSVGTIALGGSANNSVLSTLMEKFNFIVVVVGTVVVSYVAVMSTINTAQEGTAMGKKWSAVWIPMRSVAGMAMMIPAPSSGYSMIQVTVMWIVLQGIGAADQLWNIALNALASGVSAGGTTLTVNPPTLNDPTPTSIGDGPLDQLLSAQICMQTFNAMAKDPNNVTQPYYGLTAATYITSAAATSTPPNTTNATGASATGNVYFGTQQTKAYASVCGQIPITASVSLADYNPNDTTTRTANDYINDAQNLYNVVINTIQTVLNIWTPLAQGLIQNDALPSGQTNSPVPPPVSGTGSSPTPPGYYLDAKNAWINGLSAAAVPGYATDSSNNSNSTLVQTAISAGTQNGWIVAGSYYFVFYQTMTSKIFGYASNFQSNFNPIGIPACSTSNNCYQNVYGSNNPSCAEYVYGNTGFTPGDFSCNAWGGNGTPNTISNTFGTNPVNYVNRLSKYLAWGDQYMVQDVSSSQPSSAFSSSSSNASGALSSVGNLSSTIIQGLSNTLQSTANGNDPLFALSVFGHTTMIACEAAWLYVFIETGIVSVVMSAIGALGILVFDLAVLGFISGLLATFWALGASLAIYMPLIPYMIFTTTALGWMLTVVEAVIAAPIIALGIVIPSGDELGKIEHALMLLANIFLRPMLMIFGFLLAGRVYAAVVTLINYGMADVFKTINVTTMFSSVVVFFVYCAFIISVTNTSFSLIYAVPDKILRWIGGGPESTGEQVASSLSETKSGTTGAAQQTGGDISGGSDAISKRGLEQGKAKLEAQAKAKAGSGTPPAAGGPPAVP